MRDKNFIKSLERGLKILEILGEVSRPLTLTEIANLSNLNKTSTKRFLHTLGILGYVNRDGSKRFFLGSKNLSLGFSFLNSSNLRKMAKPYLDELAHELKATVNLAVLDNLDMLFLYRKEVKQFLKYDLQAGSKLPAYLTACGKMLLAGLPDDELKKKIDAMELHQITPKTNTSKKHLLKDIRETRKRGYSVVDRELSMDLYTVGVPVINGKNRVVAAMNAALQIKDVDSMGIDEIVKKLMKKGEQISRILEYEGSYPNLSQ